MFGAGFCRQTLMFVAKHQGWLRRALSKAHQVGSIRPGNEKWPRHGLNMKWPPDERKSTVLEVNLTTGEPRKTAQLVRVCAVCSAMGLPVEKVPQQHDARGRGAQPRSKRNDPTSPTSLALTSKERSHSDPEIPGTRACLGSGYTLGPCPVPGCSREVRPGQGMRHPSKRMNPRSV